MLSARVAHEINNPLAVISGNLEVLARELGTLAAGAARRWSRSCGNRCETHETRWRRPSA